MPVGKEKCDMVDSSCRIKLFCLIKSSHTAFRTVRGKRIKKYRDTQSGHIKKEDKPPPAVPVSLHELLNADLKQIADPLPSGGVGKLFCCDRLSMGCRDPPN